MLSSSVSADYSQHPSTGLQVSLFFSYSLNPSLRGHDPRCSIIFFIIITVSRYFTAVTNNVFLSKLFIYLLTYVIKIELKKSFTLLVTLEVVVGYNTYSRAQQPLKSFHRALTRVSLSDSILVTLIFYQRQSDG